jgi:leucine dehydrogenase
MIGQTVFDRGILYAPDYVINGGGIINVAAEIRALEAGGSFDGAWVATKLDRLAQTLGEVIDQSIAEKRPANLVADEIARARIAVARG